jgi:preprotein translocase subunit SecG
MHAGLVILMIISGVIFIGSVLLMSPKGGIGLGIG